MKLLTETQEHDMLVAFKGLVNACEKCASQYPYPSEPRLIAAKRKGARRLLDRVFPEDEQTQGKERR